MISFVRFKKKLSSNLTEIPEGLKRDNFETLTGLRGIAILIVLFYHLGLNHFLSPFGIFLNGRLGVDIFFILSGFLITTSILKEKINTGKILIKKFYIKRLIRILPLAYVFLITVFILNHFFSLDIGLKSYLCGFLFLKNMPVNGIHDHWTEHLWSLSVEFQFYLVFPFLVLLMTNKIQTVLITTLILIFAFFIVEMKYDFFSRLDSIQSVFI